MKKSFYLLCLLFAIGTVNVKGQSLYFPPLTGTTWDTVSFAELGWCDTELPALYNMLQANNSKAFIILKDGKIAVEKYFGTFTRDSLWYWASAGKTLTGFTVGIAQQQGFLSINDTASKYLGTGWTAAPPDKEAMITVRHLLTMSSGLDDGVPESSCTLDTCLQYLADAGTRWAYHTGAYTKLDGVINGATGQTLNSFITQRIKTPTGITGAFYQSGYNNVFVSTARSMARFGLLLLNKGTWNGTAVLNDTAYFNQMTHSSQNLNYSYGYLTWLNGQQSFMVPGVQLVLPGTLLTHAPNDMFAAMGKNGQFINVVPSMNLVLVRMGNAPSNDDVPFTLNDTIWRYLNPVMCNATGLNNPDITSPNVSVFPNPFTNEVHLQFEHISSTNAMVRIYNLLGEPVFAQPIQGSSALIWDGKTTGGEVLPAGVYIAELVDGVMRQRMQVVKVE